MFGHVSDIDAKIVILNNQVVSIVRLFVVLRFCACSIVQHNLTIDSLVVSNKFVLN